MPAVTRENGLSSHETIYQEAALWLDNHSHLLDHQNPIHTPEAYFAQLLQRGLEARQNGNYGIAASISVSIGGMEVLIFGENRLVSDGDPTGHAETTTLQRAAKVINILSSNSFDERSDKSQNLKSFILSHDPDLESCLITRTSNPNINPEEVKIDLWTSLEPCPMCTVASCNGRVHRVIWGKDDEFAGQMHPEHRLPDLSPLWPLMFKDQEVELISTEDDQSFSIPEELRDLLNRMFIETKGPIDEKLKNEGFMRWSLLVQAMLAEGAL